ncbi:tRNA (adenosine(37)-N6)-threonylcarbamoyltransferase complex dimerization subunit type 1 TsaB [Fastidiosibacter lacustris]|uniref:tRNA (adenosine(37)-N6)-threonylcarbamoyltransferase complex dimerization subunit type 1 TsaB n=1 Tax=Fastidiosibacter lacustris TaxID=2056695 RepID=UPI000E3443A2|nr:tRNA (adenosine(37)-N6)-threonylcarbamoyltransferase complex dimerization subunit type 1 TsaB [Fastidiosibacter lacustris]
MNILAIDTSSSFCSVTLFVKDALFTQTRNIPREHNEYLLPMINELISQAKIQKTAIDLLAYGVGPGSFVGVRLSAAVMQAMSLALDKPVVGFSSMYAIALDAYHKTKAHLISVILDARMADVYCGQYSFNKLKNILEIKSEDCFKQDVLKAMSTDKPLSLVVGDCIEGLGIKPDIQGYCPDTQHLYEAILTEYQSKKDENRLNQQVMPIYLQGTSQWKKIHV